MRERRLQANQVSHTTPYDIISRMTHDATAPANIQALLPYQGSLTHALRQQFAQVSIAWRQEGFISDPPVWQRDVLIAGDGTVLVFARTTVNANDVARLPAFQHLGDTPLGDWLFQTPSCQSIHFALVPLEALTLLLPPLPYPPIPIVRDRLFRVEGIDITVRELFLDTTHATC